MQRAGYDGLSSIVYFVIIHREKLELIDLGGLYFPGKYTQRPRLFCYYSRQSHFQISYYMILIHIQNPSMYDAVLII